MDGAASVIAVIQLAGAIAQICGTYIRKVGEARHDIVHIQEEVDALSRVLKSLDSLLRSTNHTNIVAPKDLTDNLARCSSTLTTLREKIDPGKTQKPMRKWGLRAFKWPLHPEEVDKTISEIERYKSLFSLSLLAGRTKAYMALPIIYKRAKNYHQEAWRLADVMSRKIDIDRLHVAKGAAFNDYENQHTECLTGTRVEVLRDIDNWTSMPNGKCIFWLNGMAGTGKSTISRTVAGRLKGQDRLAASFFFRRGEQDRGNAKLLFSTVAKQLGSSIPQLSLHIQKRSR